MDILAGLHPLVIHIPVGLLMLYMILEILNLFLKSFQLQKFSLLVLSIGVLGGVISVLTGNQAFQLLQNNPNVTQMHYLLITKHELYATITMWYFLILLIFQFYIIIKKKNESVKGYLFVIFVIVGVILLYKTARFGGSLVYDFGIGTKLLN